MIPMVTAVMVNHLNLIVKGFDYLKINCLQGGAIIFKDGTYDARGLITNSSISNLSNKYVNMKVSLIAETLGKVKLLNCPEWMVIEYSSTSRVKICMYGIILNFYSSGTNGGDIGGDDWINEYYNCVIPANYRIYTSIVPTASVKVENCLFLGSCRTTSKSGTAINCASKVSIIEPSKGTILNCLYKVSVDSNYNITSSGWENAGIGTNPDGSVANIGVYGGQFSWGSTVTEYKSETLTNLTAVPDNNKKHINLSWTAVTGSAISYNIYRTENLGTEYQKIGTSTTTYFTDVDANLLYDKPYYYVITAVSSEVESSYSNEVSATLTKPVTKLKLVLQINEVKQLSITEELSDNIDMIWTSSDPTIATVDVNGKVKALKPGNTIINCTSEDGEYTETINVLVVDLNYQLAVDLVVGDTCRLTVDDLSNTANVIWTAYDPSIATVSNKGKITAVSEGLTYVTATDTDGKEIGRIYIRVRK